MSMNPLEFLLGTSSHLQLGDSGGPLEWGTFHFGSGYDYGSVILASGSTIMEILYS